MAEDTTFLTLLAQPNSGTITYTITADPDSKFQLANGDEIQLEAALDAGVKTFHTFTVQAENAAGSVTKQIGIGVQDPAGTIVDLTVLLTPVNRNTPVGTTVGYIGLTYGSRTTDANFTPVPDVPRNTPIGTTLGTY
jgi:hypothetical protein